jgi:hypothetical protein
LPRRGGKRHGLLVLRLPLSGVALLMLRLPVPRGPTVGR